MYWRTSNDKAEFYPEITDPGVLSSTLRWHKLKSNSHELLFLNLPYKYFIKFCNILLRFTILLLTDALSASPSYGGAYEKH